MRAQNTFDVVREMAAAAPAAGSACISFITGVVDRKVSAFSRADIQYVGHAPLANPPDGKFETGVSLRWDAHAPHDDTLKYVQKTFSRGSFMEITDRGLLRDFINRGRIAFILNEIDAGCAIDAYAQTYKKRVVGPAKTTAIPSFETDGAVMSRTTHYLPQKNPWQCEVLMTRVGGHKGLTAWKHVITHLAHPELDVDVGILTTVTRDVYKAIALMHTLALVHSDPHTMNIMIGEHDRGSLLDYGLSSRASLVPGSTNVIHHLLKIHKMFVPEYITGDASMTIPITPAADVWQIGLSILLMARATYPGVGKDPGVLLVDIITSDEPPHKVLWELISKEQRGIDAVLDELLRENAPEPRDTDTKKKWAVFVETMRLAMRINPIERKNAADVAMALDADAFTGMPVPVPYNIALFLKAPRINDLMYQHALNYHNKLECERMRMDRGTFLMYRASRYGAFFQLIQRTRRNREAASAHLSLSDVGYIEALVDRYSPDRQEYVGVCAASAHIDTVHDGEMVQFCITALRGRLFEPNAGSLFIHILHLFRTRIMEGEGVKEGAGYPPLHQLSAFYTSRPELFDIMDEAWINMTDTAKHPTTMGTIGGLIDRHYTGLARTPTKAFAPNSDRVVHTPLYEAVFALLTEKSPLYIAWKRDYTPPGKTKTKLHTLLRATGITSAAAAAPPRENEHMYVF